MIRAVGRVEGAGRLRLSSIEPDHLDEPVLEALAAHALPHLHVPLQAGSDAILAAMRRRYRGAGYLRRIERARSVLGVDLHVTADVMVGFPGETEDDFARTLELVAAAGLGGVHVFPYSPRPGTRTDGDDPVPAAVKRERSERLRAAVAEAGARRLAARVGTLDEVLVERVGDDGRAEGYGRDYTRFRLDGPAGGAGALVRVRATAVVDGGLEGRAVAHSGA